MCLSDEDREEDTSPYVTPADLPIGIAYEDSEVTVADKPSAMPAHPSFSHRGDTVANALAFRYSNRPYVFRPVNRLDGDTSGLMITANTHLSAFRLGKAMINGEIGKMYIAILKKEPPEDMGVIDLWMKRCADSIITRRTCDPDEEGARRAVTVYKKVFTDPDSNECAVIASPVTGRTHQLRVHFAALGCPMIGDYLYGETDPRIPRHALHAAYCSFPHPSTGERIHVFSPLCSEIKAIIGEQKADLCEASLRTQAFGDLSALYDKMKKDIR
ncbi:MAG: RluA family pseudouridine synthase [Clostridia bacterium]|nr:RluA family pseudouridine synthase [Clostridia bacterium]